MEKIACSLFSIFRKNVDDAATSLRSARVMREEAMQEVNDAIRNLKAVLSGWSDQHESSSQETQGGNTP